MTTVFDDPGRAGLPHPAHLQEKNIQLQVKIQGRRQKARHSHAGRYGTLTEHGVPEANIHRDVGISGGTGTNSRTGWRALDAKLAAGDTLVVVAIDRIGRRWMDTVNAVRDLRTREVKIRSLAQSEATWVTYLAAEPDTAEAVIGDILTTFMAWAGQRSRNCRR